MYYLLSFFFLYCITKLARILQYDEIGISFSGSKNGKGGRPGAYSSNSEVNESGMLAHKTSQRVSSILGMNYEEEALPPYHVLATSADRPYIEERFFKEMQHVVGEFWFSSTQAWFSTKIIPIWDQLVERWQRYG